MKFPNTINGNWETTKPLEIVVSDMTCIYHKGVRWEWTYILDTYNNEIIASSVTNKRGSSLPYYHCLNKLIEKQKSRTTQSLCTQTKVVSTLHRGSTKPINIIPILNVLCQEPEHQRTIQ